MGTPTSCVICSQPRTGSWFLCEALQSTGVAGLAEEYVRPDWAWRYVANELEADHRIDFWPGAKGRNYWPEPNEIDADAYFEAIRRIAGTENGVLGIKLHLFSFRQFTDRYKAAGQPVPMTEATLRRWFPNPRYVILTRRDHLRQAISHYRAIDTDDWWERDGKTRSSESGNVAVAARPEPYLPQIELMRRSLRAEEQGWRDILAGAEVPPIELAYEDFTADPKSAVAAVLRHIGVEDVPVDLEALTLTRQADELTDQTVHRFRKWQRDAVPSTWPASDEERITRRRTMNPQAIVVENFYADPVAVRDYALKQQYYAPYESEEQIASGETNASWLASRFKAADDCPFKSSEQLVDTLEDLIGEDIDRRHWRAGFATDPTGRPAMNFRSNVHRTCLWNTGFHVKLDNGQQLGEGIHNHVTDVWNSVDTNGWAGLIYLSPDAPLSGGLNLWRNKDPARQWAWMTKPEDWELVDTLANVPNRLLLCRGSIPHSGANGWGDSLETGRLYQTFFFRTLPSKPIQSIDIEL